MRKILANLLGSKTPSQKGSVPSIPDSPAEGQLYGFTTKPYNDFAPATTGRHAVVKVLGTDDVLIVVGAMTGIWTEVPILREAQSTKLLHEHRFAHQGRPAVFGVTRSRWTPNEELEGFTFLGSAKVSRSERSLAQQIMDHRPGARFAGLRYANFATEGEFRWSNDRDAFEEEHARHTEKVAAERAAKEERYRTRLRKLTWNQLLSETPFENWTPSPPYPPAEFTTEARQRIIQACLALQELGPKPRRPAVRKILKELVLWFNATDAAAGHVIETEEREDIYAVLEEMAHVSKQKALVDEIDEWRDW